MVSGGATPRAFSTSVHTESRVSISLSSACAEGKSERTSKTVEPKLVDLIQGSGILEIVLDDVNVIGGGQKTREFGRFGVP